MTISKPSQVLLLDGDTLPALSILRSLGKQKVTVDIASHVVNPLSAYSKYAGRVHRYPHPLDDTDSFLAWVSSMLEADSSLIVIPATERTLVPISQSFGCSQDAQRICMAEPAALETVLDKSKTTELANSLSIPQPRSWQIRSHEELEQYQSEFSYPIVIKPGRSIADASQRVALTVKYAHTAEELANICEELLKHVHLVLQTYFRGEGLGIELIARHGEILYAFQHQRLHEMPLSGGGSSYRQSVEIDPVLLETSEKLIRKLNWHGVAMVEFKKNIETGDFILIEINGRFWGSLPLATAAGADFPYMLYQLYTRDSITPSAAYRRGIKCRKLSSDLAWFEAVLRKDADKRLVNIPSVRSALRDMLDIFSPKHYLDAQSLGDIKPGLMDVWRIITSYTDRLLGILTERKQRQTQLAKSHYSLLRKKLKPARKLLFICYGNINRSAVAHALSDTLIGEPSGYTFKSAGFHTVGDRPADLCMVDIAEAHSIPMRGFTSTVFTPELADWADIIFVMETNQVEQAEHLSPSAKGKTFLLGGLYKKGKAIEISDPYGKSLARYDQAFTQVKQAITHLQELV